MSRERKTPTMDLRLNLSPPTATNLFVESPNRSATSPAGSPQSSCVSSENVEPNSPETKSMVLAGCPRCLLYVMLSDEYQKCPRCHGTVLLDFQQESMSKTRKI
ncbi:hypothetical protein Scep_003389 [Stephania cephalantha]|uniref:GIR1-like zinc ribbon domain-containing protein n=1 Tax=Stephania cephalantha TaxID=152367 RepID=A0AAP0KRC1_9MAGN